ncbi:MAG: hypothetical protein DRN42_02980 [Thermoplasmata archaeon]|nr:MAG: hypothetical protein DRN42_02980 [Thermoplasmata archaeon]
MKEENYGVEPRWISEEEFAEAVDRVFDWLSASTPLKVVRERLDKMGLTGEKARFVVDVARTRFKAKVKFSRWREVFFTPAGLRWATPEDVGAALQERLKGYSMADLGAGQGGQVIHRQESEETVAVEIDPLNASLALRNVEVYSAEAEIVVGDALDESLARRFDPFEVIFSDPYRGPTSTSRTLEELEPNPLEVMKLYGRVERAGFVFELPPQIREERIPFDAELEYVSFGGEYNRLNVYTGELRRCSKSVLILPGGFRIEANPPYRAPPSPTDPFSREFGPYLYEVDPAVARASLLGEAVAELPREFYLLERGRRTLLTSPQPISSPVFRRRYRVLRRVRTLPEVREALKEEGFSKASLRFRISPEEYWRVRRSLEEGLPEGREKATIFKVSGVYLVAVMEEV